MLADTAYMQRLFFVLVDDLRYLSENRFQQRQQPAAVANDPPEHLLRCSEHLRMIQRLLTDDGAADRGQ